MYSSDMLSARLQGSIPPKPDSVICYVQFYLNPSICPWSFRVIIIHAPLWDTTLNPPDCFPLSTPASLQLLALGMSYDAVAVRITTLGYHVLDEFVLSLYQAYTKLKS